MLSRYFLMTIQYVWDIEELTLQLPLPQNGSILFHMRHTFFDGEFLKQKRLTLIWECFWLWLWFNLQQQKRALTGSSLPKSLKITWCVTSSTYKHICKELVRRYWKAKESCMYSHNVLSTRKVKMSDFLCVRIHLVDGRFTEKKKTISHGDYGGD